MAALEALPAHGLTAEAVLAEIEELRRLDLPTHGGRLFAYVYDSGVPGLDGLAVSAYALCAATNGLDPTAFPSLLAMENALVGAAASLLGGGPAGVSTVVGNLTSGGTESLMLAVKAARDARPDIVEPELVMPASAHAAFAKAAAYLKLRLVPVPISAETLKPAPSDVKAAITDSTVLVACSAPSYAHGVVDPVEPIAAAAAARGVRCHVDACFGGWTLPYLRRLGLPVPPFDFSVPGVTSVSVDLHKYAYCPKGVSVLLHRDESLRAPQYFAYSDWPGYTMINPVIASTRPGGPIAASYATVRHLGYDGYLRLAQTTLDAVRALAVAVSDVDGLRLMPYTAADAESTVVVFTSVDPVLDPFVLVDELAARGWHTQAQLSYAGLPRSIHLSVTAAVAPRVAEFGPALADGVAAARAAGPVVLPAELAGLVSVLAPADITPQVVAALAARLGLGAPGKAPLPERQALINTVLDLAPIPVREALVSAFLSLLQRPTPSPPHPEPV
jgi:glutamate/tyrosine decarboxylase-like PLP-dependent enzyme